MGSWRFVSLLFKAAAAWSGHVSFFKSLDVARKFAVNTDLQIEPPHTVLLLKDDVLLMFVARAARFDVLTEYSQVGLCRVRRLDMNNAINVECRVAVGIQPPVVTPDSGM